MAERKKEDRAVAKTETRAKTTDEAYAAEAEAKKDDTQTSTIGNDQDDVEVAGVTVKREGGYWTTGAERYHSVAQAWRAANAKSEDN